MKITLTLLSIFLLFSITALGAGEKGQAGEGKSQEIYFNITGMV